MALEKHEAKQTTPPPDILPSDTTGENGPVEMKTGRLVIEVPQETPKYLAGWRLHVLTVG